jgi:hypothetical protein
LLDDDIPALGCLVVEADQIAVEGRGIDRHFVQRALEEIKTGVAQLSRFVHCDRAAASQMGSQVEANRVANVNALAIQVAIDIEEYGCLSDVMHGDDVKPTIRGHVVRHDRGGAFEHVAIAATLRISSDNELEMVACVQTQQDIHAIVQTVVVSKEPLVGVQSGGLDPSFQSEIGRTEADQR